jgi:transposase
MELMMVAVPLSDQDWSRISYLFTEEAVPRFGRPRRAAREVLDAVLWVIVNGEKWHRLPPTFPPQQTCYIKYLRWRKWGIMDEVFRELGITGLS